MSKIIKPAVLIIFIVLLIIYRGVLKPIIVGAIAAYILDLPAKRFERLLKFNIRVNTKRILAVGSALLCVILFITGFIALLVPRISESAKTLSERLPYYWELLHKYIDGLDIVKLQISGFKEFSVADKLNEYISELIAGVWNITRNIGSVIASSVSDTFTSLICCLYMLFCKKDIMRQIKSIVSTILSEKYFKNALLFFNLTNDVFSKYISGRIIESLVLSVLCFIGLALSGTPYAPLLSLVIGISNLIPFLGPLIGTIPCVILLLLIEPIKALWFAIFIIALQQLDNNILYPRIVGTSVGLPTFWTVFSVFVGLRVAGTSGAFIAVPFAAIIYKLIAGYIKHPDNNFYKGLNN